jgi:hypothetical protein
VNGVSDDWSFARYSWLVSPVPNGVLGQSDELADRHNLQCADAEPVA